jgi:hypothetical protein
MGLDIGAMSNLRLREDLVRDEDWEVRDKDGNHQTGSFHVVSIIEDFKEVADGLQDDRVYEYDEYVHVRAGSYGGYSRWRYMLCEMALGVQPDIVWANPERFKGAPFFELINFSDCEGTIGCETAQKLFHDFMSNRDRALAYSKRLPPGHEAEYWLDKYGEWMKAFELASKDGCVDFH